MGKGFSNEYRSKLISAGEAAGLVQSNSTIHLGGSASIASIIDKYLALRKGELENVVVRTYLDTLMYQFLEADPNAETFKWYSGFLLGFTRGFANERGSGVYIPSTWHNAPSFLRDMSLDIFYVVTAPMDDAGYFNFGITVAESMALCDAAKKIVAVIREDMPYVYGGNQEAIHISRIDHVVEDREFETFCLPAVQTKEEDRMIASNIIEAGLIQDGSTLQIGIGGLPNSVLDLLKDANIKNCNLHTEMLTEKMRDLIEEGIITNATKPADLYKTAFSFCLGSRELYDYIDRNPNLATYPVDYINHPMVVAQQPNMFSLNSTTQVDMMGQVASEMIGGERPKQVSGTGGQLDFVLGTMMSMDKKGVSVIGLYSEHKGKSRIVPTLEAGTSITVPRSVVDHVATEWGLVKLRGLTINERAQALIAIAHPKFRDELTRQAYDAGFITYPHSTGGTAIPGVLVQRS